MEIPLPMTSMLVECPTQSFSISLLNFYSIRKTSVMLSADLFFMNTELHPLPFVQELQ